MTTATAQRVEFLDLVETVQAHEATMDRLLGQEGVRVGSRKPNPEYERRVARFASLLAEAKEGSKRAMALLETAANTTSDFGNLFGDVLQRQLLGSYREAPQTYTNYVRTSEVPDFRSVKRFAIDGAEGVLGEVGEDTEYPEGSLADKVYTYAVKKYGRRLSLTWEAYVNDDLGSFSDLPRRLGLAARRTEEKFATGLFVDVNGPHASLYTAGNKNIINVANGAAANNPPLSIAALQDAFTVLSKIVDADGEPIVIDAVELVVPPALQVVAENILNSIQLEVVEAGGTTNQRVIARNWMSNRTRLSVNYYIPVVASTANGNTSWFLMASAATGRPALEVGFLRGNREPAVFRKISNAERVGGGAAPLEDFETDSQAFKVRHVLGGTRIEPKATVASNGSGA